MIITNQLLNMIKLHADATLPRECCGFIVESNGQLDYRKCTNTAEDDNDFVISAEEYASVEDDCKIICVVHSHPNESCEPSMADKVSCEESQLPWLIMSLPSYEYKIIQPEGYQAPYVGRPFTFGVLDCYSIIKDWYKRERDIDLPHFNRHNNWWKDPSLNYYVDNFETNGFYRLPSNTQPIVGDVFLMQIKSPKPNHAALYIGDGKILQHMYKSLSQRYTYGGTWAYLTTHHLRHA